MPIAWTKTNRQKITAIRHPHKADPQDLAFPSAQAAWSWMRDRRAQNAAHGCTVTATRSFAPLLNAVMSDYETDTPPKIHDPYTELMRMVVLSHDGFDCYPSMHMSFRALVALWMEQGGPEFVLSLFDVEANFAFLSSYSGMRSALDLQPLEPNPHGHKHLVRLLNGGLIYFESPFWTALRAWLFAAPQPIYNHAFDIFCSRRLALINGTSNRLPHDASTEQCRLDFAFSRDPIWAHEDALAILSPNPIHFPEPIFILASLTYPALALALVKTVYIMPHSIILSGYDIIESLGDGALPVFEAYKAKHVRMDAKTTKNLESLIKLAQKK
jgi:hypothetical protein